MPIGGNVSCATQLRVQLMQPPIKVIGSRWFFSFKPSHLNTHGLDLNPQVEGFK